jgi:hypothetical protein
MEGYFSKLIEIIPYFLLLLLFSWKCVNRIDGVDSNQWEIFARNSGLMVKKNSYFSSEIISGNYSGHRVNISIIAASGFEFGCVFVFTQFNVRFKKALPYYLLINRRNPNNIINTPTCYFEPKFFYNIECKGKRIPEDLLPDTSLIIKMIDSNLSQLIVDGQDLRIRIPGVIKENHLLRNNLNMLIEIANEFER